MSKVCARWKSRISRNEGKKVTNRYALFTRYNHSPEIEDIIHIDYSMAQQNGEYFDNLVKRVRQSVTNKRCGKLR